MFFIKKIIAVFAFGLWMSTGALAQGLIQYLPEKTEKGLSREQHKYLDFAMSSPFAKSFRLATVDVSQFERSRVNFNFNNNVFGAEKLNRQVPFDPERRSWIGEFPNMAGAVHVVTKGDDLVGMIQIEDLAFLIRPLGEGLHAIVEWDMTAEEGCRTPAGERFEFRGGTDSAKYKHFSHPDLDGKTQREGRNVMTTGECNIRVLVAYTDDVDDAVADILMDIINMVNLANTGYANSATGADNFEMSIELAVAYEVNYAETGDIDDDLDWYYRYG